jgi:hypothetical protein
MTYLARHPATHIWLLLIVLTGASRLLAENAKHHSDVATLLSYVLVSVAFFKVRLVGLHFMELRHAPPVLRGLFEVWVVVVCAAVLGLYWATPALA